MNRYLIAGFITTIIFIIGILLGLQLSNTNLDDLQNTLQKDLLEMQSLDLEILVSKELNNESICSYIEYRLPNIIKTKVELGRKFDTTNLPPDKIKLLQKQYAISLMKYWLFTEVQEKQCKISTPRILFFFTSNQEASREQGRALDYTVYLSNETISVFAFNVQWDEPLIKLLINKYNVTDTPTIIINETKHDNFQSVESMAGILCSVYGEKHCFSV